MPTHAETNRDASANVRNARVIEQRVLDAWSQLDRDKLNPSDRNAIEASLPLIAEVLVAHPEFSGKRLATEIQKKARERQHDCPEQLSTTLGMLLGRTPALKHRVVDGARRDEINRVVDAAKHLARSLQHGADKSAYEKLRRSLHSAGKEASYVLASAVSEGVESAGISMGEFLLFIDDTDLYALVPHFEFAATDVERIGQASPTAALIAKILNNRSLAQRYFSFSDNWQTAHPWLQSQAEGPRALRTLSKLASTVRKGRSLVASTVAECAELPRCIRHIAIEILVQGASSQAQSSFRSVPHKTLEVYAETALGLLLLVSPDGASVEQPPLSIRYAAECASFHTGPIFELEAAARTLCHAMSRSSVFDATVKTAIAEDQTLRDRVSGTRIPTGGWVDWRGLVDLGIAAFCLANHNLDFANHSLDSFVRSHPEVLLRLLRRFCLEIAHLEIAEREQCAWLHDVGNALFVSLVSLMSDLQRSGSRAWIELDECTMPRRSYDQSAQRWLHDTGKSRFEVRWRSARAWSDIEAHINETHRNTSLATCRSQVRANTLGTISAVEQEALRRGDLLYFDARSVLTNSVQDTKNRFIDFVRGFATPVCFFDQTLTGMITPKPGFEEASQGGRGEFRLHTDLSFLDHIDGGLRGYGLPPVHQIPSADLYLIMLCLEVDSVGGYPVIAHGAHALRRLSARTLRFLREHEFPMDAPGHIDTTRVTSTVIQRDPVTGAEDICFHPRLLREQERHPELKEFVEAFRLHELRPERGRMYVVRNGTWLHGRTALHRPPHQRCFLRMYAVPDEVLIRYASSDEDTDGERISITRPATPATPAVNMTGIT